MLDEPKKRKNPGFPMPPSFRIGDNQHTNDLMSRLQTFLPQMKAANQAISSESIGQVDIELKKESDDEDDSDSDAGSKASDSDDKVQTIEDSKTAIGKGEDENGGNGRTSEPMIQIQFALTDPNNPMMELLANGNDKKEEGRETDGESEEEDDDGESPAKMRAIKSMLKSPPSTIKQAPPKISILEVNPSLKKSLITEFP